MFDFGEEDVEQEDFSAEAEETGAGLQPPRLSSLCYGFEATERDLLAAFNADRMPHALIFSGLEGIGKATFAFRIARFLLKQKPADEAAGGGLFGEALPVERLETMDVAPDDPVFRQVASGGHSDLMVIERPFDEKKGRQQDSVPVDEARRITPFLRMTASQGGWRVVIVDDADTMNRNAQNAILKILEEPPACTVLILIAHRAGSILPTIRSRCRTFSFAPLPKEVFADLLRINYADLPQADVDTLYAMTGGSVGQALRVMEEGGVETVTLVLDLLKGWPRWDWIKIHGLADTLSRQGQERGFQAFQDVFLWIVKAVVRARATGLPLPAALQGTAAEALLRRYDLSGWLAICENLESHFNTVDFANLDKRQAILGAFMIFDTKEAA